MTEPRIRISVPRGLADHFLRRAMAPLATRFPHLVVEIVAQARDLDTARREPEIALRGSRPANPALLSRQIADQPGIWLLARPEAARLARVRAVIDHLAASFDPPAQGSKAA